MIVFSQLIKLNLLNIREAFERFGTDGMVWIFPNKILVWNRFQGDSLKVKRKASQLVITSPLKHA